MSASRLRRFQRREPRAAVRILQRPKLSAQLLSVWDHARSVFASFCEFFAPPVAIADREYIHVPEYRAMDSWLRSLELLTRRLILAAALSINVALQPTSSCEHKTRQRCRVLIWFSKPASWIARLRMFPRKRPQTRAHRFAVKLARIAARNAKGNEPRLFGIRAWDSHRLLNRGQRVIRNGMGLVMPPIEDRLAAWNARFEPG